MSHLSAYQIGENQQSPTNESQQKTISVIKLYQGRGIISHQTVSRQRFYQSPNSITTEVLSVTKLYHDRGIISHQTLSRQRYYQSPNSIKAEVLSVTKLYHGRGIISHQTLSRQRYYQSPNCITTEVLSVTKLYHDRGIISHQQNDESQRWNLLCRHQTPYHRGICSLVIKLHQFCSVGPQTVNHRGIFSVCHHTLNQRQHI